MLFEVTQKKYIVSGCIPSTINYQNCLIFFKKVSTPQLINYNQSLSQNKIINLIYSDNQIKAESFVSSIFFFNRNAAMKKTTIIIDLIHGNLGIVPPFS